MKIKILIITVFCFTVIGACKTNTNEKSADTVLRENIPFNVAKNYFVKNNVNEGLLTLKISTQEDFDKYFGMATTMNQKGKPTPIDFSEGYVIAVICETSTKNINITPESLVQDGSKIDFTYQIIEGVKQTYKSRVSLILIVNNKYTDNINFIRQ